jgi:hypothetical protein
MRVILIVLFILLFMPIKFRFRFFYNFFTASGNLKFKLLNRIKLINLNFKVVNGEIELITNKGKIKRLPLKIYDPDLEFLNQLQKALFKRLIVKKFYLAINVGVSENPFLTSMLSGYIQAFLGGILSVFSFKSGEFKPITSIKTTFSAEKLDAKLKGQINISIISLALSIVKAYFKKQQKLKLEKIKKAGQFYGN